MKLAGFLLLLAGWLIAVSAILLLRTASARMSFVLAALGVEAAGLVIVFRSHLPARGNGR